MSGGIAPALLMRARDILRVSYFVERFQDFKKHLTLYGAVAYLRSGAEAPVFAPRRGWFAIRSTGDSRLINTKIFEPKAFA